MGNWTFRTMPLTDYS